MTEIKAGDWVVPVDGPSGNEPRHFHAVWPSKVRRISGDWIAIEGCEAEFFSYRFKRVDPPSSTKQTVEEITARAERAEALLKEAQLDAERDRAALVEQWSSASQRASRLEKLLASARAQGEAHLQARLKAEAERDALLAKLDKLFKEQPPTIDEWCVLIHALAVEKGWWPPENAFTDIPEKLALIHSEVSEALEEYRNPERQLRSIYTKDGKPEGFLVELADVVIRVFDLCGALGVTLEGVIEQKHKFNQTRPVRHGGKRC